MWGQEGSHSPLWAPRAGPRVPLAPVGHSRVRGRSKRGFGPKSASRRSCFRSRRLRNTCVGVQEPRGSPWIVNIKRWTSRHSIDTDLDADSFTIAPALASADAVSRPRNENENGTSKFPTTSSAKKVGLDGASGFPIDVTVPLKPPTKASRRNSAEIGRPRAEPHSSRRRVRQLGCRGALRALSCARASRAGSARLRAASRSPPSSHRRPHRATPSRRFNETSLPRKLPRSKNHFGRWRARWRRSAARQTPRSVHVRVICLSSASRRTSRSRRRRRWRASSPSCPPGAARPELETVEVSPRRGRACRRGARRHACTRPQGPPVAAATVSPSRTRTEPSSTRPANA